MATQKINVTVEKDSIRVDPETLTMTSADDVQWAGTNPRAFSIMFDDQSLFGQREMQHGTATTRQRPRVKGRFKYTVISTEDRAVQLDPIIIVDDPPTTP
jgi:plastocyanin